MSKYEAFLAGERPDDVAIFLPETHLDEEGRLRELGEPVEGGVVLVVDGEKGRQVFRAGTGLDLMEFAQGAMDTEGHIDGDLTGAETPDGGDVDFVFAFAERQNEEVGGIYAEGDVVHAYARSSEGAAFSDRWVVGSR
ncbi:MAG: DUF5807 family protein [Haloferacaceae archaeon]